MLFRDATVLVILLFVIQSVLCQNQKNSPVIGLRPHYGFIVKHSGKLGGLTKTFPWGVELDAGWQLMTEKSWQYCFCYPYAGVSFLYINFANTSVLGSSFALYPYIEPAINGDRKLFTTIRFGMGPVYLDNVFDSVSNPENLFYSSHVSFIVHADIGINYHLNKRLSLRVSANFNHISNGGIKNPNLGINYPTAAAGLEYNFYPLPYLIRLKDKSVRLISYNHRIDITVFGTGKTAVKGHERYPVYGISSSYSRVMGRQNALSVTAELTVDLADRTEIRKDSLLRNGRYVDHKYLALLAGHELILGRFNFYQQLGVYVYSPFSRKDKLYQRYGLNFSITEKVFIGINLKAHRQVADFLDFRSGISF